jgi:bile acid:Na+ symporter, BASS family
MLRRGLARASDWLLALAVAAVVLALVAPSSAVAARSDLVLAALVAFTALGIAPAQLATLNERRIALGALVLAPFVVLPALAWVISRLFSGPAHDGVLALGVSSTEVAAVGLVALSGGSAVLALGGLAGSLVLSALLGPVLLGALAGGASDVAVGELVVRFTLVVVVPLVAGLIARAALPRLEDAEEQLSGLATIAVAILVYAAVSGADTGHDLLPALAASALFLAGSAFPAAAWAVLASPELRWTGGFVIELRDFAVAATLAAQAFGPAAATVCGVYGVLMLLLGAAAARAVPALGGASASNATLAARANATTLDSPGT